MIGAWMLTYLAVGALLLVVAGAADHVAAARSLPRRGIWAAAMVAMLVAPVVYRPVPSSLAFAAFTIAGEPSAPTAAPRPDRGAGATDAPVAPARATDDAPAGALRALVRPGAAARAGTPRRATATLGVTRAVSGNVVVLDERSALARLDGALAAAWAGLALLVAGVVATAAVHLRRAGRSWTRADAATRDAVARAAGRRVPVWLAPDTGPAAFGLRTPQVVLPVWLADRERTLLIAHEGAHVRAGDPRLLAAGLAMVVLLPWHLPLVVAYRRLCRAVEHDCDARVLARHRDVRGYARLLVQTAEWRLAGRGAWRRGRGARLLLAPVPAFAAPASELEGRLRALVRRPVTWRTRLGVALACGMGGAATIAACAVPSPTTATVGRGDGTRGATVPVLDTLAHWRALQRGTLASARVAARMQALQDSLALAAARRAIPAFDELARGFDTAYVWLVVDESFRPVDHAVTMQRHAYRWDREFVSVDGGPRVRQRAATPATPHARLASDIFSFGRAFPTLDSRRIDAEGDVVTATPAGAVRLTWGQLYPGDTTQLDVFRAQGDSLRVPTWFRTVVRAMTGRDERDRRLGAALDSGLRRNIATFRPELLERGDTDDPYVWFVLGPDGTAIAHATGRAGLGLRRAGWPAGRPLPRAGGAARDSLLTVDAESWRAKFPALPVAPPAFGWTTMTLAGREVNVLWALTDLSLVTGGPRTRGAARGEAGARAADTERTAPGRRTGGGRDLLPTLLRADDRADDATPHGDRVPDAWSFPPSFPRLRFARGHHPGGMRNHAAPTVRRAIARPA